MVESADYDDATAAAVAIGATNLVGTGLARESGGNLDTHTSLLSGATVGALISGIGRTVGQEVAALIASGSAAGTPGGTPLLHGHNQLYSNASQVLAVNGSFTPPNIVFTKPSYIIHVTAQMAAGGSAMPSVKLNVQWRSSASGSADVDQQIWHIPAGGGSAMRTNIKGPVIGDTLNITFTNGDAVNTCTLAINIYEGTWGANRHDGRSNGAVASAGANAVANDANGLIIADGSFTAAGASTTIVNLPLYAGQANLWINQNVAGGSQISIVPTGDFDLATANPIASLDWTAPPHQLVGLVLPRCWCQMQITNNAAGGQIFTFGMTALEYAS